MELWQALSAVLVGLCIGLVLVAWFRLPSSRISRPLFLFVSSGTLWVVGDLVASVAGDVASKQVGIAILYSGAIFLPSFWWIAALRWAEDLGCVLPLHRERWVLGPLAWFALMWLAMITNPWHGSFLTPVVGGRNVYGPLWWAMAIPNYALIIGVLLVELEVVRRVPLREVRRQAAFLISASLVTLIGNVVYTVGMEPFNATAVVLAVSAALLYTGMVRDGLFGVLPVALPVLAEHDPDGIIVVRPGGRVAYLNPRARELLGPLGVGLETRLPQVLRGGGLHPETPNARYEPGLEQEWWNMLEKPEGALYRVSADQPRWLHWSARSVPGRRGPSAFCLRVCDVTAEKQAEVQLRRTHRLESVAALAGRISQGFQNSFAVILGNADLASGKRPLDPAFERRLARIVEAGERGLDLAQQLQLYTGEINALRVVLDLSDIAEEEVSRLLDPDSVERIQLHLDLAEELLVVEADESQLRQVLGNLLENAREAISRPSRDGGEIAVSTGSRWIEPQRAENLVVGWEEPAGEYAYVRIADDGVGMDSETQERVFEPFFSTKGKSRGSGLSSVLGIVRAHGALLELETQPARGSVFTLYLPRGLDS